MPLDAQKLTNWPIPELVHTYTAKDTILYALGIGCGSDPLDRSELQFVYEDGLKAFPSMVNVLGYPGFWLKEAGCAGVDWRKVLHGEQYVEIFSTLPNSGTVVGRTRVVGVHDKGAGRDAVLITARDICKQGDNQVLATVVQTTILRGHGGFGGSPSPASVLVSPPERAPDVVVELATMPQAALIYRLSGDMNPLHADPSVAEAAGFPGPILHGLCTLGVASRAVLRACYGSNPVQLRRFGSRFSSPVYPGETLRTEIWHDDQGGAFRTKVVERNVVVLTNGVFGE